MDLWIAVDATTDVGQLRYFHSKISIPGSYPKTCWIAITSPLKQVPCYHRNPPNFRRGLWQPPRVTRPGCELSVRRIVISCSSVFVPRARTPHSFSAEYQLIDHFQSSTTAVPCGAGSCGFTPPTRGVVRKKVIAKNNNKRKGKPGIAKETVAADRQ